MQHYGGFVDISRAQIDFTQKWIDPGDDDTIGTKYDPEHLLEQLLRWLLPTKRRRPPS